MHRDYVSFSAVSLYNKCPRAYHFKYRLELPTDETGDDTSARDIGSAGHAALEAALRAVAGGADPVVAARERLDDLVGDYTGSVVNDARAAVGAYLPELGIGTDLRPVVYRGTPAVEWEFDVPLQTGINFRGVVDAVCETADGRTVLIDWKFRRYLADDDHVRLDPQLYLYADVWQRTTGIPLDAAYQVQLSTQTPAPPTLNLDGTVAKSGGKTTEAYARSALTRMGQDVEQGVGRLRDAGKVMPLSHFVRVTAVDLSYTPTMVNDFNDAVATILEDRYYRRAGSVYACRFCPFKSVCLDA